MRTAIAAFALIAALAAVPAAYAASQPAQDTTAAEKMFSTMDTNKDGVLTKEEFAAHHMADDFAKADKNGDGKVTRDEYLGHASGMKMQ
ncbi:calcium-binding protein [Solidesulfovibrio sp. C21]|uniref:calcium-binding protein n=1 Tax=Solidesulfovibrio sp. C21 TaxID=3398613 RepID=UPI0039FB956C